MKFLVVAAAGVALLAANGNITFFWGSSAEAAASPGAREVLRVMDAATTAENDLDDAQLNALIERVLSTRTRGASRIFAREFGSLARRADRKIQLLATRVRRTPVRTAMGFGCRLATLSFLERQRVLFRRFARELAHAEPTAPRVAHFTSALVGNQRWYVVRIRACTAEASAEDRAAVENALE